MRHLLFLIFMISSNFLFAQILDKSSEITLNPEGSSNIRFDFKHNKIETKNVSSGAVKVIMEIRSSYPESVMNQLVKSGRYRIETSREGNNLILKTPELSKKVTIGGKELKEEIVLKIDLPSAVHLKTNELSLKNSAQKFNKNELLISTVTIQTPSKQKNMDEPEKSQKQKTNNKKKSENTAPAAGQQERQAHFGEILIDGVKLEVE